MANMDAMKAELSMGLRLVAYKSLSLDLATMAGIDEGMKENHWDSVSKEWSNAGSGFTYSRFFYDTAQKNYVRASCDVYNGSCTIEAIEESHVLESLSFEELKKLGNLLDKKSVAFIRIYSEKEMASAKTEEEQQALNERNAKMIQEAEEALRKR